MKTSPATIVRWLVLTGTSVVAPMVHAAEAIDGHRLFFTQAQRTEASLRELELSTDSQSAASPKLAGATATGDTKIKASTGASADVSLIDTENHEQNHFRAPPQANPADDYRVFFNGHVTGSRTARLLVNGLPCDPVPAKHGGDPGQLVSIHCHGVQGTGLTLSVVTRTGELMVMDAGGRERRLLPGEGM